MAAPGAAAQGVVYARVEADESRENGVGGHGLVAEHSSSDSEEELDVGLGRELGVAAEVSEGWISDSIFRHSIIGSGRCARFCEQCQRIVFQPGWSTLEASQRAQNTPEQRHVQLVTSVQAQWVQASDAEAQQRRTWQREQFRVSFSMAIASFLFACACTFLLVFGVNRLWFWVLVYFLLFMCGSFVIICVMTNQAVNAGRVPPSTVFRECMKMFGVGLLWLLFIFYGISYMSSCSHAQNSTVGHHTWCD